MQLDLHGLWRQETSLGGVMAITCGKKARKAGGGTRAAIKRSWRRGGAEYRVNAERRAQHEEFEKNKRK